MCYDPKLLGELIRAVRTEAGLSATKFREMAGGIDSSSFSRIENPEPNFYPRADKFVAVLSVAANLPPIIEHIFNFSQYLQRPYGEDTVNFFLSMNGTENSYAKYIRNSGTDKYTEIKNEMPLFEQPIKEMILNHISCAKFEKDILSLIENYRNICSSCMLQKYDSNVDSSFKKMLAEGSAESALEFVKEFINYLINYPSNK